MMIECDIAPLSDVHLNDAARVWLECFDLTDFLAQRAWYIVPIGRGMNRIEIDHCTILESTTIRLGVLIEIAIIVQSYRLDLFL